MLIAAMKKKRVKSNTWKTTRSAGDVPHTFADINKTKNEQL